ncbi:hypothetical protein LTR10_020727 [Elasticomyces elasticus]|uniref:C2H2-type domain-containing protein n=1 Tax=Exophiala sideris TaxID=1016849 RepID=A0ABR0JMQ3_9EURO|nr:hypothetical protein LTR10_020727 [Elasticomyces elasticus]KAK5036655.1 hypothetical protein LTS07_002382 [Exophiala sideris]KAK5041515.1 hypothetical protein LTR13_002182 [Exophiala sideris]KAK5067039.1 hypothetical protein LTR69_002387 [Exophiala sideris]KAK5185097.1 hypothetical protein LTR44_002943 [Eurotiomycetes sp. CCFEE 6388]
MHDLDKDPSQRSWNVQYINRITNSQKPQSKTPTDLTQRLNDQLARKRRIESEQSDIDEQITEVDENDRLKKLRLTRRSCGLGIELTTNEIEILSTQSRLGSLKGKEANTLKKTLLLQRKDLTIRRHRINTYINDSGLPDISSIYLEDTQAEISARFVTAKFFHNNNRHTHPFTKHGPRSSSDQTNSGDKLIKEYGSQSSQKPTVYWCPVTQSYAPKCAMKAAHIMPQSLETEFIEHQYQALQIYIVVFKGGRSFSLHKASDILQAITDLKAGTTQPAGVHHELIEDRIGVALAKEAIANTSRSIRQRMLEGRNVSAIPSTTDTESSEYDLATYTETDILAKREMAIENWRINNDVPQLRQFEVAEVDDSYPCLADGCQATLSTFDEFRDHLVAHCCAIDRCILCVIQATHSRTYTGMSLAQELTFSAIYPLHWSVHGQSVESGRG